MILGQEENRYIMKYQKDRYYRFIKEYEELLNKLDLKKGEYYYILKEHFILKKQYETLKNTNVLEIAEYEEKQGSL